MGAREALLIEAIGEMVHLIDSADRLTLELREASREIGRASEGLRGSLAAFETQVLALCEKAKVQVVKHRAQIPARGGVVRHAGAEPTVEQHSAGVESLAADQADMLLDGDMGLVVHGELRWYGRDCPRPERRGAAQLSGFADDRQVASACKARRP